MIIDNIKYYFQTENNIIIKDIKKIYKFIIV